MHRRCDGSDGMTRMAGGHAWRGMARLGRAAATLLAVGLATGAAEAQIDAGKPATPEAAGEDEVVED